jgi:hypothetical protein
MSFQRGRLVSNPFVKAFEFGPNLDIIPNVSAAYEQAAEEDKSNHDHILRAHRNFLRDAVYFLYEHNRVADATRWYNYLAKQYPDKTILDNDPTSIPSNLTVDDYAVRRIVEDVSETSRDRVKAAIEGMLVNSYSSVAIDEDERALGYKLLARKIWTAYMSKIPKERIEAIGLPPLEQISQEMLTRMLDPEHGVPLEVRAILRSKLGMPAESVTPKAPAATTNAVTGKLSSSR